MKKPKKELTSLQKRMEVYRQISQNILKLRNNKLFLMKRKATGEITSIIMPEDMDKTYVYYCEYASDTAFGNGPVRGGGRLSINQFQFFDVIPWTKKMAPLTINMEWLSDEYKKKAFG